MPGTPDIAVIVTTHREGRALVPTLRALAACLVEAGDAGLTVEVVITRDNADDVTRRVVDDTVRAGVLDSATSVRVLDLAAGDLSVSRNAGVSAVSAAVIGVLDADNLPSANWLHVAYRTLSSHDRPVVVHPPRLVRFGSVDEIRRQTSSMHPDFRPGHLVWFNVWDAFSLTHREVLVDHPYPVTRPGSGFGPEDWAWNCVTIAAGIEHVLAPDTTLFYRVKDNGLAAAHGSSLPPSIGLLHSPDVAESELDEIGAVRRELGPHGSPVRAPWLRASPVGRVARLAARMVRGVRRRVDRHPAVTVAPENRVLLNDETLRQQWAAARVLQPRLPEPTDAHLCAIPVWESQRRAMFLNDREAYWAGVHRLSDRPDLLLVVGGARAPELAAMHVAARRGRDPEAVVDVVVTDGDAGLVSAALPESVTVVDLTTPRLDHVWAVRVLALWATQLRPAVVHVVDSIVGLDLLEVHAVAIGHASRSRATVSAPVTSTLRAAIIDRSRDYFDRFDVLLTDAADLAEELQSGHGVARGTFAVPGGLGYDDTLADVIADAEQPHPRTAHRFGRWRWFADEATQAVLRGGVPPVLLHTGSNGHSNFGDILQNTNMLAYWQRRGDHPVVLFMPAYAAMPAGRDELLRGWFGIDAIVYLAAPGHPVDLDAVPAEFTPSRTDGLVHVIGGGYLNRRWGGHHFDTIDAMGTLFDTSQVLFTGLQIDESAIAGFSRLRESHDVVAVGTRDAASWALVAEHMPGAELDTFDDLTEYLADWARSAPAAGAGSEDASTRVAIHMNTSDYAGGAMAVDRWRHVLATVAATSPDEVYLISAFSDARSEVVDTWRSVAALAEDFPFAEVHVIDLAGAALRSQPGDGLPAELEPLTGVDYALCSSYHTALLMTLLGVPTHLVAADPYFDAKAVIFGQRSFEEFMADPTSSRPDLGDRLRVRREWLKRLDGFGPGRSL
ncbi:MAG: glycosyltransferase [Aeromicrobium sp.]|uniref:glycosyltransferase n=1 Tax=Aeromicrobium sp. TaxID=1871063 RepID=UPI0026176266|nr:glycosyltransferase [Aeromicrobium sp.]MDF1704974.1 glycosyltransferase [Aeromicrobium sp.]